jgi:hypothetical protein
MTAEENGMDRFSGLLGFADGLKYVLQYQPKGSVPVSSLPFVEQEESLFVSEGRIPRQELLQALLLRHWLQLFFRPVFEDDYLSLGVLRIYENRKSETY